jgi:hypothetical protein
MLHRSSAPVRSVLLIAAAVFVSACADAVSPHGSDCACVDAAGDSVSHYDGHQDTGPPSRVPRIHRASATMCATDRPPSRPTAPDGGMTFGTCQSDAQCTMGTNGRCTVTQNHGALACTYDACTVDSDCGATAVCACREASGSYGGANVCITGNCRVDSDCGASAYCSPSYDNTCGPYDGVRGYYCHTADDACIDDSDCVRDGSPFGYCTYHAEVAHWACSYSICAG